MKKLYILALFATGMSVSAFAQFTKNNLVVVSTVNTGLGNSYTAVPVTLKEFSTTGASGITVAIPSTGSGDKLVVDERTQAYEGQLRLTASRDSLMLLGFNALAGNPGTANTEYPLALRKHDKIIMTMGSGPNYTFNTKIPNATWDDISPRGVIKLDNTFYVYSFTAGERAMKKLVHGSNAAESFATSTVPSYRMARNISGDLIVGTRSDGTGSHIFFQTPTNPDITNLPLTVASGSNYTDFMFFDMAPNVGWNGTDFDVLYIGDTAAGIRKFFFDGSVWQSAGVFNTMVGVSTTTTTGFHYLTGRLENGKPALYGVRVEGAASSSYSASSIVKVLDDVAYNETWSATTAATLIKTAESTERFKGISFTPTSDFSVLPIKLTSFTGSLKNYGALLTWTSASEVNAKSFEIEKSTDGVSFATLGKVAAKSPNGSSYSFSDADVVAGDNYYRLKLVDNDGSFEYSAIVSVKAALSKASTKVYPNPAFNQLTVEYPEAKNNGSITIISFTGAKVASAKIAKGEVKSVIDISGLAPGTYVARINNGAASSSVSFIKQ